MTSTVKRKIIKRWYIVAVDEYGDTHQLTNYPEPTKGKEVLHEAVDGVLTEEWRQDQYTDGSYARSESKYSEFEITEDLNKK